MGIEKNVLDQFSPQAQLIDRGVKYVRYSFTEMETLLQVDKETGIATILGKEVALFYFRDGYMPHHYIGEAWRVREQIELSRSIKCPDVTLQILNMKYFQWVLNQQSTWQRYGFSDEDFNNCKESFCPIYRFSDFKEDKQTMIDHIEKNGGFGNWVLKPQREGGANNYFGEHIKEQIDKLSVKELNAFILMERIQANTHIGIQCDWKQLHVREVIDEIGFFRFTLSDNDKLNETGVGGTLVRSKVLGTDEGGVGMGFSVINSICLTD